MTVKVFLEKEKRKRKIGIVQMVLGIVCLAISLGLFATSGKYALPIFAIIVSAYMILGGRETMMVE